MQFPSLDHHQCIFHSLSSTGFPLWTSGDLNANKALVPLATQELPNQEYAGHEHCLSEEQTFCMWIHWEWRLIFTVTNCIRNLLLHKKLFQNLLVENNKHVLSPSSSGSVSLRSELRCHLVMPSSEACLGKRDSLPSPLIWLLAGGLSFSPIQGCSQHGSWVSPEQMMRERERQRQIVCKQASMMEATVFVTLPLKWHFILSLLLYTDGHTEESWNNVIGYHTRVWIPGGRDCWGTFWRLATSLILHIQSNM